MRPKILLYADSYNGRVGTSDAYADFFSRFGEVILISPQNDLEFFIKHCDILALPGGADVDPARYEEYPSWFTGRTNAQYEFLDVQLLSRWIKTSKPIISICRGAQTLNVALGGNLIQHVSGHVGGDHRDKTEDVIFTSIPTYPIHYVNSYHHQAIGKLGEGLEIIGWGEVYKNCPSLKMSEEKLCVKPHYEKKAVDSLSHEERTKLLSKFKIGKPKFVWGWSEPKYYAIPEIVRHTSKPYLGFQYHPEEFNCDLAVELITEMLDQHFGKETKLNLLSPNGTEKTQTTSTQGAN